MTPEERATRTVRIAAANAGCVLFRNNSGVATNRNGKPVRFGLANESATRNKVFKSSDLIGWTADGLFLAIEVKPHGWEYTGTNREVAQQAFHTVVRAAGGRAGFATGAADVADILAG